MKTVTFIALAAYTGVLAFLAYLFCFGDPGTFGGLFPFVAFVAAIPLTAAMTYCATATA